MKRPLSLAVCAILLGSGMLARAPAQTVPASSAGSCRDEAGQAIMAGRAQAIWAQAGTLRVKRQEPVWTGRGKLMPLHLERQRPGKSQS
jgi:hypothetical protein